MKIISFQMQEDAFQMQEDENQFLPDVGR